MKIDKNVELLREETSENFGKLDKKYKLISEGMFVIVSEIKETNKLFEKRIEKVEKNIERTEKNIERLLEILVEEKKK